MEFRSPVMPETKLVDAPGSDRVVSRSLIDTAYRRLRRDIIEGIYAPEEKLRVEHLRDVYEVSSGTLREALALLVSDSLVIPQSQRGFRVAPMSMEDIEDLTRTRTLLELTAARESLLNGNDEWEARVVSAFHKLSRAEERHKIDPVNVFNEWEQRNSEFHEALVSACNSRWILQFRSLLYHQSERYRRLSAHKGTVQESVHDEHREIFQAAMARDQTRLDHALTTHIQLVLVSIRKSGLLR